MRFRFLPATLSCYAARNLSNQGSEHDAPAYAANPSGICGVFDVQLRYASPAMRSNGGELMAGELAEIVSAIGGVLGAI